MTPTNGMFALLEIAVVVTSLLGAAECAKASSFQGLGHLGGGTGRALGVSADGQVVVGISNTGSQDQAFRWTSAAGMVGLGVLSSGSSAANAASADGSVIVGRSGNGHDDVAFRWTAASGLQSLGVLSEGRSEAFAVSANGTVIAGVSGNEASSCSFLSGIPCSPPPPPGTEQAFRWTAATGMVGLGTLPLGTAIGSMARSVSADGSVVSGDSFTYDLSCFPQFGGFCVYFKFTVHAFRWTSASGPQDINGTNSRTSAWGINGDGAEVVGQSEFAAGRWSASSGFVSLGLNGVAHDASGDGTVIVGGADNAGADNGGAFLWRQEPGFIKTMLVQLFGQTLAGWTLSTATGISDDGLTIVGWGINPLGQEEGWIARLDRLPTDTELTGLPPISNRDPLLSAVLPLSRSAVVGTVATVFATILNRGPVAAIGCRIALATPIPARLDFHATDPATNQTIGQQNTPIDIPSHGSQSFVIGFTAMAPFPPTDVRLAFDCANTPAPAATLSGINTVLLSASATAQPDIIALAASGDPGFVDIPGVSGTGAFAVATVNVGTGGQITASADTGAANLAINISLCQTNPATGICLGSPTSQVTTQINTGQTPTFAIFVAGTGTVVAFDPANSRVFVRFKDAGGVTRGATGVAVKMQ